MVERSYKGNYNDIIKTLGLHSFSIQKQYTKLKPCMWTLQYKKKIVYLKLKIYYNIADIKIKK